MENSLGLDAAGVADAAELVVSGFAANDISNRNLVKVIRIRPSLSSQQGLPLYAKYQTAVSLPYNCRQFKYKLTAV